jgi:hypothetical protein
MAFRSPREAAWPWKREEELEIAENRRRGGEEKGKRKEGEIGWVETWKVF